MRREDGIIAAFSEDQVERLTGLTRGQLRYWDRTGFFAPSHAEVGRGLPYGRIYAFKDVAALRAIAVLRSQHHVPLHHLRKVAGKLAHLSDHLWTGTTLYVLDRKVIFHDPDSDRPREIVSGQHVIGIPLKRIVDDTRRDASEMRRRPKDRIGRVERSRHVSRNAWVIAGTRIPVAAIRRFHEAGYTAEQIIAEYPDLTARDVKAALAHDEKVRSAA